MIHCTISALVNQNDSTPDSNLYAAPDLYDDTLIGSPEGAPASPRARHLIHRRTQVVQEEQQRAHSYEAIYIHS